MRTFRLWAIGAFWVVLAGVAPAQVKLVYKLDGQDHVISGISSGRLVYQQAGQTMPVTGRGEWEIRPAESYAAPMGAVDVSYSFQPWLRQPAMLRDGKNELSVDLKFHAEDTARNLYYICGWEVDGRLVAVTARAFSDANAGTTVGIFRQMPVKASDQRGRLRAYVFLGDKSLRGVSKADADLASFRSSLDQGNTAEAAERLRGLGQGRLLPQALVEQVARAGDAALLELALSGAGAKHTKGRDGEHLLMAAAQAGRENCVEVLLRHNVDLNPSGRDASALFCATAAQSASSVKKLLAAGARPERDWEAMDSSLRRAVESGNAGIVQQLLDHGGKIPAKWKGDVFGQAARDNYGELISLLLQREAKPEVLLHALQLEGEDPLMLAAFNGATQSVEVLLKRGATLTQTDKDNRTASGWALKGGHGELALTLLRQSPLAGLQASRLLHDALLADQGELVSQLLADGATPDPTAKDFDTVIETVVRTANLPVLARALDGGLNVDRKFNRDWNLAGMADRYHRPEILAVLEKKAGRKLAPEKPKPEKLEVNVGKSGPMLGTAELGKDFAGGEAQVDIFIDAEGVPHLPMLRSATDDRLGRAALTNVLTWRFDRLAGKPNVWRRIIFPYDLPKPDATLRIAQSLYFDGEPPWIDPASIPSPGAVGEAGVKQAAWVRFVVTAKGEIEKTRIVAVTTPGIEDQVLEVMKSWHYYPARQAEEDIACPLECVVILPGKLSVVANSCIFLGRKSDDDLPADKFLGSARVQGQMDSPPPRNAIVLATFTVDRDGSRGKLKFLGSVGPKFAASTTATFNQLVFDPIKVDGKSTEYPMAMVLVFRDPRDQ